MKRTVRIRFVLLALLLVASIVPNMGFEVNTFGFHWNFYRIVVVLVTLCILILFRGEIRITERRGFLRWMAFFLLWLAYGAVLMVVSTYADKSRGVQELFTILCALLTFFGYSCFDPSEKEIEWLLRIAFLLLTGLTLFGFYEIITANHLSTSMFMDPENLVVEKVDTHTAAGIMYNINDFSALLTMLCPIAIGRFRIRLRRGYLDAGWLTIAGVVLINRINDANICNAALLLGVLVYLLVSTSHDRRKMGRILLGLFGLLLVLVGLYLALGQSAGGLVARWQDQMDYMSVGGGSMHARILIYRDALVSSLRTGFLGLGPAGFPVYCEKFPSDSNFVNPHSFLLEILSQYGIVIFVLFLLLLIWLAKDLYRMYRYGETEVIRNYGMIGVVMIAVYIAVSFAPSSFILNTYPWGLLALLLLMRECGKRQLAKENEKREEDGLWMKENCISFTE